MTSKHRRKKQKANRAPEAPALDLSWVIVIACALLLGVYLWLHEDVVYLLLGG